MSNHIMSLQMWTGNTLITKKLVALRTCMCTLYPAILFYTTHVKSLGMRLDWTNAETRDLLGEADIQTQQTMLPGIDLSSYVHTTYVLLLICHSFAATVV